jgi:hypothetical protein
VPPSCRGRLGPGERHHHLLGSTLQAIGGKVGRRRGD